MPLLLVLAGALVLVSLFSPSLLFLLGLILAVRRLVGSPKRRRRDTAENQG